MIKYYAIPIYVFVQREYYKRYNRSCRIYVRLKVRCLYEYFIRLK